MQEDLQSESIKLNRIALENKLLLWKIRLLREKEIKKIPKRLLVFTNKHPEN